MGLGSIGPTELLIILAIILLIFGGSKIPGLAKGLGQGIREFKKALSGTEENSSQNKPTDKEKEKNNKQEAKE
ncbi:twin-arginine translocase TatA/TatE family subunit [candidate division KSB1 bacterium]|nr:MAG: hypothetical protein B5M50_05700 [candidate division KSB1 bacterium 4484_219]RKY80756.1 MAG: twin-arginine translocase TatA/TatE family subunit [candidate division KSB1 bacterium]HDI51910.1 twin-arginine translocase TatA/TatE family subunit [Bacteroidota bacterium]RKY81306.1 MAG: twin-arginine translocase TatA/TatE family subunit [candidate division KSB1 bacterium]RKY87715.1 MAG: twin-arginine translocase TatA/TatE family subunit [candidate division KSB1 bacterium]